MDGIDVGKEILRQNPGCRIIIASGEWERFKEGYVIRGKQRLYGFLENYSS